MTIIRYKTIFFTEKIILRNLFIISVIYKILFQLKNLILVRLHVNNKSHIIKCIKCIKISTNGSKRVYNMQI